MKQLRPFSEVMCEIRADRGWSRGQMAMHTRLSVHMVQTYEYGRTEPTVSVLVKLCQILRVTPAYLLGFELKQAEPEKVGELHAMGAAE